jgi:hypothetical protein
LLLWRRAREGCRLPGEDGNLAANQIGYQRRQPIIVTVRPAVFDCHILCLDIAGFIQSLVECSAPIGKRAGRPRLEMPNHRQCRLLCTCGERPSGRTAEHTETLAPFSSSLSSERGHCIGQRRPLWNGPEFTSGQLSEGLANVSNGSKPESFPCNGLMSAFASPKDFCNTICHRGLSWPHRDQRARWRGLLLCWVPTRPGLRPLSNELRTTPRLTASSSVHDPTRRAELT